MDTPRIADILNRDQILALSVEDKKTYFENLQVRHRNLGVVANELMRLLDPHNSTSIVSVIGATGVGKTSFSRRLIKRLVEKHAKSEIPFIFVPARVDDDKKISWATLYRDILNAGNEVLITKKKANLVHDGLVTALPHRKDKIKAWRDAVAAMLIGRKVRVLVIDEAFHLLRFGNYGAVMDIWKSLVDETKVKLVFLGPYDLFDLMTQYGQIARRSEILHFERYKKDSAEDVAEFGGIVSKLQEHWPCEQVPRFEAIVPELMEASLGVIGLLKSMMENALAMQMENHGVWNPAYMAHAAKSMKLLGKIREEVAVGERKLAGATYGESVFAGEMLSTIAKKMG